MSRIRMMSPMTKKLMRKMIKSGETLPSRMMQCVFVKKSDEQRWKPKLLNAKNEQTKRNETGQSERLKRASTMILAIRIETPSQGDHGVRK